MNSRKPKPGSWVGNSERTDWALLGTVAGSKGLRDEASSYAGHKTLRLSVDDEQGGLERVGRSTAGS